MRKKELRLSVVEMEKLGVSLVFPQNRDAEAEANSRRVVAALNSPPAAKWIDPNDKTQSRYLPHIGEPVLFCHQGKTYYGLHTGGSFKTGHGVTAKLFGTWDCFWMPLPEPVGAEKGGAE